MVLQKTFQLIYTLVKLNILFISFLFNSPVFSQILTEWNITSEIKAPPKTNRYKSCQKLRPTSSNPTNPEETILLKGALVERISTQVKKTQYNMQKMRGLF